MPAAARRQHQDPAKYVACVLWLIGHSYGTIAKVLAIKRSQAAGIINRSEYAGRTKMSRARRTALLRELEEVRFEEGRPIDGGLLDRVPFKTV